MPAIIDEPSQRIDIGTANTNRIYLADALGSIVALTDSSKNISNTYTYEAFGATTMTGATNKNSYEFTSRENDGTGLYYCRARYYDPALGRFISEDLFEFIDGPNTYYYVGNNPFYYVDPLGLSFGDYLPIWGTWRSFQPQPGQSPSDYYNAIKNLGPKPSTDDPYRYTYEIQCEQAIGALATQYAGALVAPGVVKFGVDAIVAGFTLLRPPVGTAIGVVSAVDGIVGAYGSINAGDKIRLAANEAKQNCCH